MSIHDAFLDLFYGSKRLGPCVAQVAMNIASARLKVIKLSMTQIQFLAMKNKQYLGTPMTLATPGLLFLVKNLRHF
jgi:hypothetical protein